MKTFLYKTATVLALAAIATPAFAAENVNASVDINGAAGHIHITNSSTSSLEGSPRPTLRTNASSTAHMNGEDRMQKGEDRGDKEVSGRINSLNQLLTKVSAMTRLTSDQKTSITATVNAEISALTALEAQFKNDTSTTTLKADVGSITKAFRVFMLVEPQIRILAAADRADGIADLLTTISTKIATRVSSASNPAAVQALLNDLNAKIASAKTEANAAISASASLKPDNGDQTIAGSNEAALKTARTNIQAAQKDLQAAREDAKQAVVDLGQTKVKATATASTTSH